MQVEVNIRQVPLDGVITAARMLEEAGVDIVSDAEVRRDPLLTMAALATATHRVHLATAISIAFARSPMVFAYAARNLNDLSEGRFHLGLGTQVKRHIQRRFGAEWGAPGPHLRDVVGAIRDIWAAWEQGVPLDHQSEHFTIDLMNPEFDLGPSCFGLVPIEIAAVNPYNLGLAARDAEAVRLHVFSTPKFVREVARPRLAEAAAEGGRDLSTLTVVGGGFIATGATEEQVHIAREQARSRVAFYGSTRTYRPVLEVHGWEDLNTDLRALADEGRWDDMPSVVPDEILDEFVSAGTYENVAETVHARYGAIVDRVQLPWPVGDLSPMDWEGFRRAVAVLQAAAS